MDSSLNAISKCTIYLSIVLIAYFERWAPTLAGSCNRNGMLCCHFNTLFRPSAPRRLVLLASMVLVMVLRWERLLKKSKSVSTLPTTAISAVRKLFEESLPESGLANDVVSESQVEPMFAVLLLPPLLEPLSVVFVIHWRDSSLYNTASLGKCLILLGVLNWGVI